MPKLLLNYITMTPARSNRATSSLSYESMGLVPQFFHQRPGDIDSRSYPPSQSGIGCEIFGSMAEPTSLSRTSSMPKSPLESINLPSEQEKELERQAVRKLDYTILPVLSMFQVLAFLDRTNIGNARVAGPQKDLINNIRSVSPPFSCHILLQSSLPICFSERLVQHCSCTRYSLLGG